MASKDLFEKHDKKDGQKDALYEDCSGKQADMVCERAPAYGESSHTQGNYTIDDYYALPEDRRVELIDGYFYDMGAPTTAHQAILGQLHLHFAACVENHPECELFFAPTDVRLDLDNRTMVQPDLLIVCRREDNDKRRINGAPDFVIEIVSPSNRAHDTKLKLFKYRNAGVREYWIVDPEDQSVVVYDLEGEKDLPQRYSFTDTIPVSISNGECRIDFARILEKVKRYL